MRLALALLGLAAPAWAAPVVVTQSGYLLDGDDRPLTSASTPFVFRLRDRAAPEGGEPVLWSGACALPVAAGYYATRLGEACGTGLDETHLAPGLARWLEVEVSGTVLLPRIALDAAPAAVNAAKLNGLPASAYALATHHHDSTYAALAHHHDGAYAALAHDHDGTYAPLAHDHDGTYAPLEHGTHVVFAGSGTANTVARSDHTHPGQTTKVVQEADVAAGGTLTFAHGANTTDLLAQAWVKSGTTWLDAGEPIGSAPAAAILSDAFNEVDGQNLGSTDQGGAWTRFSSSDVRIIGGGMQVWRPSTSTVDPAVYTPLVQNGNLVVTGRLHIQCHQAWLLVGNPGNSRNGIGVLVGTTGCGAVSAVQVVSASVSQYSVGPGINRNTWYTFRMEVLSGAGGARTIRFSYALDGAALPATPQVDYTIASPTLDGSYLSLSSNLSTTTGENAVTFDDLRVTAYPDPPVPVRCMGAPKIVDANTITVKNDCSSAQRVKVVVVP